MTEDEAKTKWCPFVRVAGAVTTNDPPTMIGCAATNRNVNPADVHCIGSACMAWRWSRDAEWQAKAEAEYRRSGRIIAPTDGYCGLAGRPS